MTDSYDIRHEQREGGGRFVTQGLEGEEAELTYRSQGPGVIIANHTGVPRQHGGRGVGQSLVAALMTFAKDQDLRIVPACSFVEAQMRRKPEWGALRAA
jgi:predicted GNAT family acetyltransferase